MSQLCARVRLTWLTPEQGGRQRPFVGQRYMPTARFGGAGLEEHFSVILEFDDANHPNPTEASLELLNPELIDVALRIRAGVTLHIMEGPGKVADALVISAACAASEPAGR